jgi:cellobiose phosphorylase
VITYRRGGTTYRIKVENPLGVSRGVASVELDGELKPDDQIPLADDGQTHDVRVVLGEKVKSKDNEEAADATREQETKR